MEVHGGADTHLQPMEEPMPEQVDMPPRKQQPVESPHGSRNGCWWRGAHKGAAFQAGTVASGGTHTGAVPKELWEGPMLEKGKNMRKENVDSGIEGILSRFANNTKLCAESLCWTEGMPSRAVNLMKFNKAKYIVLHMGWGNAKHKHKVGGEQTEGNLAEKDLGVVAEKKLRLIWQCASVAQKAKRILGCIKTSLASRLRKETLPLCSALM
ncbi:rna-directed dna polymerase from mobile element jockey-like [Willisornis vidua]|uniref:Rna-directed dna polymerase from mobile element jockey-like n=1 Tax=Willisornis vidua TaxID=1566151 RepID=A0ABQ9CPK7_9PASS|nr:rna-directed dna polymerase from mobile element jockey-like [Willisornis vidua]